MKNFFALIVYLIVFYFLLESISVSQTWIPVQRKVGGGPQLYGFGFSYSQVDYPIIDEFMTLYQIKSHKIDFFGDFYFNDEYQVKDNTKIKRRKAYTANFSVGWDINPLSKLDTVFFSGITRDIKLAKFSLFERTFGIGYRKAYSYEFGKTSLIPYYQMHFGTDDFSISEVSDLDEHSSFFHEANGFKGFQSFLKNSACVELLFSDKFGLYIANDRNLIFPYSSVFFKPLIPLLIDIAGLYLAELVVAPFKNKSTSYLLPVVYFSFTNTLSLLLYEIRRNNVFWPINGSFPIRYNYFRLGFFIKIPNGI